MYWYRKYNLNSNSPAKILNLSRSSIMATVMERRIHVNNKWLRTERMFMPE